jgi:uncharacterized protein YegP (UPF0339 family)
MAKFTVYNDKHFEFRWKFVGSNGRVVAKSGEGFKKQEDCVTSLTLLQKDIPGAALDYQLRKGVLPVPPVKVGAAPVVASIPASPAIVASPVGAVAQAIAASQPNSPAPTSAPRV